MLIDRNESMLLLVDVQERLLPAMHEAQRVLDNTIWATRVAQRLGVPVAASEQYPRGLGHTHADLRALLTAECIAEKLHFSCVAAQCLGRLPGGDRRQVVLCGIESHVCVLQTALELRVQGKDVFLLADAVSSRKPADKELALARMRDHGVEIVSREMLAFEWLRQAGSAEFKDISSNFVR
jgi:nicotinamidase-related amidase